MRSVVVIGPKKVTRPAMRPKKIRRMIDDMLLEWARYGEYFSGREDFRRAEALVVERIRQLSIELRKSEEYYQPAYRFPPCRADVNPVSLIRRKK